MWISCSIVCNNRILEKAFHLVRNNGSIIKGMTTLQCQLMEKGMSKDHLWTVGKALPTYLRAEEMTVRAKCAPFQLRIGRLKIQFYKNGRYKAYTRLKRLKRSRLFLHGSFRRTCLKRTLNCSSVSNMLSRQA